MLEFQIRDTEVLENFCGNHFFSACFTHKLWASWGWAYFIIATFYLSHQKSYTPWHMGGPWSILVEGMHACQETMFMPGLIVHFSQIKWTFFDMLFPIIISAAKLETCKKNRYRSTEGKKVKEEIQAGQESWKSSSGHWERLGALQGKMPEMCHTSLAVCCHSEGCWHLD